MLSEILYSVECEVPGASDGSLEQLRRGIVSESCTDMSNVLQGGFINMTEYLNLELRGKTCEGHRFDSSSWPDEGAGWRVAVVVERYVV